MDELMNGRYVLFWLGFVFPILWMIGALLAPTVRVGRPGSACVRTGKLTAHTRFADRITRFLAWLEMTTLTGMG